MKSTIYCGDLWSIVHFWTIRGSLLGRKKHKKENF